MFSTLKHGLDNNDRLGVSFRPFDQAANTVASLLQALSYGFGKGLTGATKIFPVIQGGCSHQGSRSTLVPLYHPG